MLSASDLKKGLKIEIEDVPYEVVDFQFVKPGKGQALYRCKLKNMITGAVTDKTYRSADKMDQADMQERALIYSYHDGDEYVFMDKKTYDQTPVGPDLLGDNQYFLVDDIEVSMLFHRGKPIEITLPNFIEKEVVETEPGTKGDTATNVLKPAKIDTGFEIQVPLFVNQGDIVRIDTRVRKYVDRVSKGS